MSNRRLKQLKTRPLNTNEFVDQIVNMMPLNPDEDKQTQDWYEKTPLMRKRINMLTAPSEESKAGASPKKK